MASINELKEFNISNLPIEVFNTLNPTNTTDLMVITNDPNNRRMAIYNKEAIDSFIGGLKSSTKDFTLLASGWTLETDGTSSQTVNIDGMPATTVVCDVGLSQSATLEERTAARKAALTPRTQTTTGIVIVCDGAVPTINIPCTLTILP